MAVNLAQLAGPFSIYILFNFTTLLLEVPLVRLFELAICHRYFQDLAPPPGGFDESACKVPAIQDSLGHLVGWKMFFDAVPGELCFAHYEPSAVHLLTRWLSLLCVRHSDGYLLRLPC